MVCHLQRNSNYKTEPSAIFHFSSSSISVSFIEKGDFIYPKEKPSVDDEDDDDDFYDATEPTVGLLQTG